MRTGRVFAVVIQNWPNGILPSRRKFRYLFSVWNFNFPQLKRPFRPLCAVLSKLIIDWQWLSLQRAINEWENFSGTLSVWKAQKPQSFRNFEFSCRPDQRLKTRHKGFYQHTQNRNCVSLWECCNKMLEWQVLNNCWPFICYI